MDSGGVNDHRFGILRRLGAAGPDAALAGLYLWCWINPLAWRKTLVAELMLVMMVEFLVVHSGPFLGMVVVGTGSSQSRASRLKVLLGLGAIYLLFAGGMSAALGSWGPILLFVWLIGAKLIAILLGRSPGGTERARQMGYWALSVVFYLGAVFATLLLPVPKFGVTQHGHFYGIPGEGEWVSHPETVIAAGFLYFAALALAKLLENPAWLKAQQDKIVAAQSRKSSSAASK